MSVEFVQELFKGERERAGKHLADLQRAERNYRDMLERATKEPISWWQLYHHWRIRMLRRNLKMVQSGIDELKDDIRIFSEAITGIVYGEYQPAISVLDWMSSILKRRARFEPDSLPGGSRSWLYSIERCKEDLVFLRNSKKASYAD